jgi:hypothetical protein
MYKAIDIATFPSLYEPFGIVALEGMLAGAATVVSDSGGLNEIVSHRIDGMKSYAGNPNSLADSILECLYDEQLCAQMAKKAQEKVVKEFNWDTISKKTMDVYKEAIKMSKVKEKSRVKLESLAHSESLGTATMINGKDTTITTLIEFFDGVVAGKHNVGFPWWGWALCIGGGVGVLFAIFLVITKTRKH